MAGASYQATELCSFVGVNYQCHVMNVLKELILVIELDKGDICIHQSSQSLAESHVRVEVAINKSVAQLPHAMPLYHVDSSYVRNIPDTAVITRKKINTKFDTL